MNEIAVEYSHVYRVVTPLQQFWCLNMTSMYSQTERGRANGKGGGTQYFWKRLKYSFSCNINTLCVFQQLTLMEVSFLESFTDERKEQQLPFVCDCFWSHTFALASLSSFLSQSWQVTDRTWSFILCQH